MSAESNISEQPPEQGLDMAAGLFANLVMQQAQMAMMMLGKTPHPETGQPMKDLEAAKLFIDTIEMLETKTRGNLSPPEQNMLKQTLMSVRMAFVEAANSSGPAAEEKASAPSSAAGASSAPAQEKPAAEREESHKKFSKKY